MKITVVPGDYKPLAYIYAHADDGTLLYRRLIRKEDEAKYRAKLTA